MPTNIQARAAIADAIDAGDANHTQYDVDAIIDGVYVATGGYDIDALEHADFWKLVEDNALPTVNIVVLNSETTAAGIEFGLAVGDAPAIDNDVVRGWLADIDEDPDTYVLVVPEQVWSAELNGLRHIETGAPVDQVRALLTAIETREVSQD